MMRTGRLGAVAISSPAGNVAASELQARPRRSGVLTADPSDAIARVIVAGLFLALAMRLGANFLETGRITGLLLLANEFLVVVFTTFRRTPLSVDRSWQARSVTALSLTAPFLIRPITTPGLLPEPYTATIAAVGLTLAIGGKICLGRSFGLVPANRGIVSRGLYRLVRHPIYLGYLIVDVGFLAGHPTLWNVAALVTTDLALLVRAVYEERTLSRDPDYQCYTQVVRWRVIPWVF